MCAAQTSNENDIYPNSGSLRETAKQRFWDLLAWSPHKKTEALIEQVRAVLNEYSDYLPLTLGQIFYRLVRTHAFPKDEHAYRRLCDVLNRARHAELLPWEMIWDGDANVTASFRWWVRPLEQIEQWQGHAESFRLDRQEGQPRRLLITVEARGIKGQIKTAACDYSVPVIATGELDSLSAKHLLAAILGRWGGLTEILHIGDHDPTGEHLILSLMDDVATLIDWRLRRAPQCTRLAVTPEQIDNLDLPTAPSKPANRRSFETVQVEAIPPDVLAQIVTHEIRGRLDNAAYTRVLKREDHMRARLIETVEPVKESFLSAALRR
jgi:hypothetical protein